MFGQIETQFGRMLIEARGGAIVRVCLPGQGPRGYAEADAPVLKRAKAQLEQYFAGARRAFDLPLDFSGCTDFMVRVYAELMRVPYGETASYKHIAERVGSPRAYRAVGLANNKNPLPVIVPCHRILGADGGLVGYAGGLELKARLLELERQPASSIMA